MKKKITAFVLTLIAVFGIGITAAGPAAAATDYLLCYQYGGRIWNGYDTQSTIPIYSETYPSGCGYANLGRIQWSYNVKSPYFRDVDAFWVSANWRCQNYNTGYNYYGNVNGTWFWMSNDSVNIHLNCFKMPVGSYAATETTLRAADGTTLLGGDGDENAQAGPTPPNVPKGLTK